MKVNLGAAFRVVRMRAPVYHHKFKGSTPKPKFKSPRRRRFPKPKR